MLGGDSLLRCDETLEQLPRELQCPISGGAQGHVGWALGSLSWWEQPTHGRGLGLVGLCGPFQPKPFDDCIIGCGKSLFAFSHLSVFSQDSHPACILLHVSWQVNNKNNHKHKYLC